ncbi:ATP-binding cassette domain-containing protein [Companilactobacillus furfuricola]|uniref:ATP-binding cassette domain-containing protein n=1 Tax=Companilactobacillus furfuricola TaxID=1462575 RepID=UPI0013DE120C|nr:ATP-binding cassette domain-containing protein [Companilactobacillus furfuricola]
MNIVEIENLTKRYKKKIILKNLTFQIENRKITSLYGDSGSGKTTLLNIIGMIENYQNGRYTLFGKDTKKIKRRELLDIYKIKCHSYFKNMD